MSIQTPIEAAILSAPASIGPPAIIGAAVLLLLALLFTLCSSHLSIVVGAWLTAHGVQLGRMRHARREHAIDCQRLSESMLPAPTPLQHLGPDPTVSDQRLRKT